MLDLFVYNDIGANAVRCLAPLGVIRNVYAIADDEFTWMVCSELNIPCLTLRERVNNPARFGLSVHYKDKISNEIIDQYDAIYNCHPGFLPYGKGMHPVFWALYDNEPAGASIHEMTDDIDEGPIVSRVQVPYDDIDTGMSLMYRVLMAERILYVELVSMLVKGRRPKAVEQLNGGSFHFARDILELKKPEYYNSLTSSQYEKLRRCLVYRNMSNIPAKRGA